MPVRNDVSTRFIDEVRIIPRVAWLIAILLFLALPAFMAFVADRDPARLPMTFIVLIPASLLACVVLLIGYINTDAGRRGMNRVLWTLIAIFVPNALGIVLYFVLRKPRPRRCPQCGEVVDAAYGFCPTCRYRLSPACPQCQRGVSLNDRYCPYCGADLRTPALQVPTTV